MKKYFVLATLFLMSTYAHAANVTWYGSAGWRYSNAKQTDGTSNTASVGSPTIGGSLSERTETANKFRGELGATGGWDNVEWGTGVRTTGSTSSIAMPMINTASSANSDWTTANSADLGIGMHRAWFKYGNDWGFGDVGITFGRQAVGFATSNTQVFMDNDVALDGVTETWKWGSFGINLGQYILGGKTAGVEGGSQVVSSAYSEKAPQSSGGMQVLYSFQPHFTWKFTDEITGMFAVGYHNWSNTTGTNFRNLIPNGSTFGTVNGGFVTGNQTSLAGANASLTNANAFSRQVSVENSKQWQGVMKLTLPYMLALDFEYIKNKELFYGTPSGLGVAQVTAKPALDSSAWAASLTYGQLKKAHDFTIGYTYHDKGLGSVASRFTYDRVLPGFTAHEINAGYNMANGMNVAARALFEKEKNGRDQTARDSGKLISTTYWEVSTGVRF